MMNRPARALASLLLILSVSMAAPAKKAPRKTNVSEQIKTILSQPALARAYWGIHVVELEAGKVVYTQNAGQLFLPASNAKLFTTAAALSIAGPDYRFQTTMESAGKIDSTGRLQGDLIIMGRGDPNISGRVLPYALKTERTPPHTQVLDEMASQLAAQGLKVVDGDVIGDDTFYSPQRYGPGWAQDDLQWIDGAPVSALTFNDNAVFFNIQPGGREGDAALIRVEPANSYYEIENRIVTAATGVTRKIGIHRETGSKKVVLWGSIPFGDAGTKEALAVEDPAELTAQIFRALLEQHGITVTGQARARHGEIAQFFDLDQSSDPQSSAGQERRAAASHGQQESQRETQPETGTQQETPASPTVVLAQHMSMPFVEDVRVINKTSQNLHAELALRLAGKLNGAAGSFEGGRDAVRKFLLQAGLEEDQFVLLDGSGLSRRDLVTPAAVVQLLIYASRQPWGKTYESTLPIAAVDGSLSERFVKTPAAGLIHAKTGTLSHVNALSGYGQNLRGKRFAFSIFCNNHNLPSAKIIAAIDEIVQALVSEGSARKQKAPTKRGAREKRKAQAR